MRNKIILFLLFGIHSSFSQNEILIIGKIYDDQFTVQGIQVINLVNEKSTVSDQNGNFYILAKTGDMLVFCSNIYDYKRKFLEQEDINNNCLIIKLSKKAEQLKEVIVYNYSKINAVSLGIVGANIKSYSPAERRILAANSADLKGNTNGTTGGSISADPIFNMFSGRTKSLKMQLEIEHKEKILSRLDIMFMKSFFVEKLKIDKDYVKAFQYYVVEDKDFVDFIDNNNKTAIHFRIIQLAEEYNKLQINEK